MFYGDKPQDTRQMFFSSWEKYQQKLPLSPLESQIAEVILIHPEYHRIFEKTIPEQEQVYSAQMGEANPFLHMGLHLALRDQIAMNRPLGIADIYQAVLHIQNDVMKTEHLFMECLEECLWHAQQSQSMPNEADYLNACRQLLKLAI